MKNLKAHKHIVACHRARNRCNEAMFQELQWRLTPFRIASQERWDGMLQKLQRSNPKPKKATLICLDDLDELNRRVNLLHRI